MSQHQDFQRIVEQAKQQRAEYIGSAIRANPIPIAGVAALALVLLQFIGEPPQQKVPGSHVVASVDAQLWCKTFHGVNFAPLLHSIVASGG